MNASYGRKPVAYGSFGASCGCSRPSYGAFGGDPTSCAEAKDAVVKWQQRLDKPFWYPGADGKLARARVWQKELCGGGGSTSLASDGAATEGSSPWWPLAAVGVGLAVVIGAWWSTS